MLALYWAAETRPLLGLTVGWLAAASYILLLALRAPGAEPFLGDSAAGPTLVIVANTLAKLGMAYTKTMASVHLRQVSISKTLLVIF